MPYVAKIRSLLRGLSLEAALLATLALPAFVLAGSLSETAQHGFSTESAIRHVSISEATSLTFTMVLMSDDRALQTGD